MNEGKQFRLRERRHPDILPLIWKWEYISINRDVRVYYKTPPGDPNLEYCGFYFYVTDFKSCPVDDSNLEGYDHPELEVECVMYGSAFYDGVRHLIVGDILDESLGYLYYPNTKILVKIFETLVDLEERYCRKD